MSYWPASVSEAIYFVRITERGRVYQQTTPERLEINRLFPMVYLMVFQNSFKASLPVLVRVKKYPHLIWPKYT